MNRVILSGEIGSDIVLKKTATGQSLCNFSIEVKEKGKNGQEFKSFFGCTAWGENAEHINQYGFRGQHIAVDGKPVYKLTKFEKELLQCYPDIYSFKVFNSLNGMKEKGYFKGIDDNEIIGDILAKCEVIEDRKEVIKNG